MNLQRVQESMMQKSAEWPGVGAFFKSLFGAGSAAGDAVTNGALYMLGASVLAGGAIGAFGAQLTAHGKQDEDTVKKEYENERLKADVGYLASRLEDEYNRSKANTKPKAARVLNV
jgi:hypothetical protein